MARDPELETAVMGVLWDSQEHLTPAEVQERLGVGRAYTTVLTVLVRLWKKGLLERTKRGRAFAYAPAADRDQVLAANMVDLVERAGEPGSVLARFADSLTESERRELRRLLLDD